MNPVTSIFAADTSADAPLMPAEAAEQRAKLRPLRQLMWLYLILWVTEGALRKWIFPQYANPLLVVRDPVLLLMYGLAYLRGVFPKSLFIGWIGVQGIIALLVSIAATEIPLTIELYGLRSNYMHLPLIFLIPAVFDGNDVRRVGFWTLVCALPMSVLVFLQFRASPTAVLNAGAGGGTNGMLVSAYGHIRPSGTFSFTNGLAGFAVLVSSFFLWQLFEKRLFPRLLWLASGGALVVLIAFSGSRSAVGAVGLIVATVLLIGFVQPRYWASSIKLVVLVGLCGMVIGSFSVFKEGMDVFSSRFGDAENVQTGFFVRFFDSLYKPFLAIEIAEPFGAGLGLGTNAASGIVNDGKRGFMLAEGDIARVILESGPVIGVAYQTLRMMIAAVLGVAAFRSLYRQANTLPMLIFSGVVAVLLVGEFAQPTELGYATITAGLCLAANQARSGENEPLPVSASAPGPVAVAPPPPPQIARGRSIYAEQLHQPSIGTDGE